MIGLIRRTFHHLDAKSFRLLYTALVRPHLDYADCIWSPHLKTDIDQLEKAQRRATKLVPEFKDMSYQQRLEALNLPSLHYRRRRMDMIQTFRILKGIDNLRAKDFFTISDKPTRGHNLKLVKQASRTNLRKFSFSNRVFEDWNQLPQEVVDCETVMTFKAALDNAWRSLRFGID